MNLRFAFAAGLFFAALVPGVFVAPTVSPSHFVGALLPAPAGTTHAPYFAGVLLAAPAHAQPFILQGKQERPGVPQSPPPATYSITRHGKIIFEAEVREPDSSRVALTETVEVSGIKSPKDWKAFISAFVDATSRAWLTMIPPSAATKKGKVIVAFALRHDGSFDGPLSIARPSGDSSIDDAARLAIAKSAPFHELPSAFLGASAQFRVTFAYNHPHPLAPVPSASAVGGPLVYPDAGRSVPVGTLTPVHFVGALLAAPAACVPRPSVVFVWAEEPCPAPLPLFAFRMKIQTTERPEAAPTLQEFVGPACLVGPRFDFRHCSTGAASSAPTTKIDAGATLRTSGQASGPLRKLI